MINKHDLSSNGAKHSQKILFNIREVTYARHLDDL